MQVCVSSTGAGTCGGGFWGVDWPNITKAHRRCCTISSTFAAAAAARGGDLGVVVVLALGWGSCAKVSGDGLMISGVPISPSVSNSSSSSSTGSSLSACPTC